VRASGKDRLRHDTNHNHRFVCCFLFLSTQPKGFTEGSVALQKKKKRERKKTQNVQAYPSMCSSGWTIPQPKGKLRLFENRKFLSELDRFIVFGAQL